MGRDAWPSVALASVVCFTKASDRLSRESRPIMMDTDGFFELNIFSAPMTPQPARMKKQNSGKSWDKNTRARSLPPTSEQDNNINSNIAQLTDTSEPVQVGSTANAGEARGANEQQQQQEHQQVASVGASGPFNAVSASGQQHQQQSGHGNRQDTNGKFVSTKSPQHRSATGQSEVVATNTRQKQKSQQSPASHPPRRHGDIDKKGAVGLTTAATKEPSHERRRVLVMAGRIPPQQSPTKAQGQAQESRSKGAFQHGKASHKADPTSSARPAKRKKPSASVAANGVVDFTVGKADTDTPRSDKSIRKAAVTAAAVARATTLMANAGGKRWWDDDDDDHVTITTQKPLMAPPSTGSKFDWNYGNGGVEEKAEDKDGGLPSDVHPNSVRTKAVNMDAEASNALGILAALLGEGGKSGGDGVESRTLKNGGKSKKRAREENAGVAADVETIASIGGGADSKTTVNIGSNGRPAQVLATSMSAGQFNNHHDTAETPMATDVTSNVANPKNRISRPAKSNDDESVDPGTPPGGGEGEERRDDHNNAQTSTVGITRKTRGKHENAEGVRRKDSIPLPEHHARPRELSRRAAATPLPSARSAHVMAAGPGATFAALGLPLKMVAHLEEPKGENGGGGMGLAGPTVCQLAAVPVLAAGHNTVIKSETGSGKTLAYLLPLLCDLAAMEPRVDRDKGTLAIVLAPTRELSAQILEVRCNGRLRLWCFGGLGLCLGRERRMMYGTLCGLSSCAAALVPPVDCEPLLHCA